MSLLVTVYHCKFHNATIFKKFFDIFYQYKVAQTRKNNTLGENRLKN